MNYCLEQLHVSKWRKKIDKLAIHHALQFMTRTVFVFFFICTSINSFGQKKQPLPVLKSTSDTLNIRYDDYLDEKSWFLSSKKRIDKLLIQIDEQPTRVTFISELDSIFFNVKPGDRYDFIISNGPKNYRTRIEGVQALFTKKADSLAAINLNCLKADRFSVSERNKQYPFNKAVKIGLISFSDTVSNHTIALPVKNGRFDNAKIRDHITLNAVQVNELTDIWFNVGRTPVPGLKYEIMVGASCYEPRNGIVFIDENDRVFEYVEICFGCKRNRYSSKRIKPWDDCEQKYEILREFFLKQGIKFGTKEH